MQITRTIFEKTAGTSSVQGGESQHSNIDIRQNTRHPVGLFGVHLTEAFANLTKERIRSTLEAQQV